MGDMAAPEPTFDLHVTRSAQDAMAAALGKDLSTRVVRLGVLPGVHPAAQMYLSKPRAGEPYLEFGPVRLVIDPASRPFLQGATVDYLATPLPGGFSIEGPHFSTRPSAASHSPSGPSDAPSPQRDAPEEEDPLVTALRQVYDPEIPVNIVDLGLIYGIDRLEDGRVTIRMTVTSPGCPVAGMLQEEVKSVAERVPGVREAVVSIVWEPPWGPERMSDRARRSLGYS